MLSNDRIDLFLNFRLEEADSEHCLPDEWVLLYRGSRDGFSAKSFHSTCDERGPTITVVKVMMSYCITSGSCDLGIVIYTDFKWVCVWRVF